MQWREQWKVVWCVQCDIHVANSGKSTSVYNGDYNGAFGIVHSEVYIVNGFLGVDVVDPQIFGNLIVLRHVPVGHTANE